MDDPDMVNLTYVYDRNGNLTTQTDNKGQVITMTYDTLNRIMSKTYSTPDPAVSYVYDTAVNGKPYLSQISNGQVVTDYASYDPMGRIASVTEENRDTPLFLTTNLVHRKIGTLPYF